MAEFGGGMLADILLHFLPVVAVIPDLLDVDALQLLEERMIQMQQATDARLADIAATITKAFQTRFDDYESAAAARAVKPLESSPADSVQQPDRSEIEAAIQRLLGR